jgi:aspartate racemase
MKTIGLIGGMSWQSTKDYYTYLNKGVNSALGKNHSARVIINSLNFQELETLQRQNRWDDIEVILYQAAQTLERAGADLILIGANTMHKCYDAINNQVKVPVIHIADSTAEAIKSRNITKVGLLGTKYTMTEDFLKKRLTMQGLEVLTPTPEQRLVIHDVIIKELCAGIINNNSFKAYANICYDLFEKGCDGIILGCTEIPLLINTQKFCEYLDPHMLTSQRKPEKLILFDTTRIHANAAVQMALEE